jgi:hypothetical protein
MMKENIQKRSMFTLVSLAVVVVCILLFRQCSGDVSTRKASADSSSLKTDVKKEITVGAKKVNSAEILKIPSKGLVDGERVNSEATKKAKIATQVKNENEPIVQKEYRVSSSDQFYGGFEDEGKIKVEDVLKDELKILTAKVNVLEEKVKALFEKMRLFSQEKENRLLAEKPVKKENEVNSTRTMETLKGDGGVIYKYPTHVLTVGLSTYEKWTGYGVQASYTYRISKFVSLGGQGNGFFKEGKYNGDRDFYMGFRANFHMFPLFVEDSRFDLYAGGTAGLGRDDDVETFETMWYLGSSYDFNRRLGVFVEAGTIGVMGLRLTF